MDIVILLICTFLIVGRLMKMLGQYDPEQDRKRREQSTVIMDLMKKKYDSSNLNEKVINPEVISPSELALPQDIRKVINDIKIQDTEFDLDQFIARAQKAYIMYLDAISSKDTKTLNNLVDKDLLAKLSIENIQEKTQLKEVQNATLTSAALYGDRAMLTVTFIYTIISFSEDSNGNVISGYKDKPQKKHSQITFSRYLTQEKSWKITKESK